MNTNFYTKLVFSMTVHSPFIKIVKLPLANVSFTSVSEIIVNAVNVQCRVLADIWKQGVQIEVS